MRVRIASYGCFIFGLALFLFNIQTFGQVDKANLVGTIRDASGAVVGGAKVKVANPENGFSRETTSRPDGGYNFQLLPIGVYTITVEQTGFAPATASGIELSVGDTRTADVELKPAGTEETIEVTEDGASVERSTSTIGIVIEPKQVQGIPLNGRHWASLMVLAPGAVNTGSGNQNSIRFNGRARDDNNWTLDGVDQTGVKDPRQEENLRLVTSLESIAEFRVNTQIFGADQGNGAGGQINIVTKSGTNDFHGGVFHFIRNSALDARNFFDFGPKPVFQLNQYGGSFGGAIVRNRTFFFVSYEGLRQRRGQTFIDSVPSAQARQLVLATSPSLAPLLAIYPAGQTSINPSTDQLIQVRANRLNEDNATLRIDHRFSERRTLFGRAVVDNASALLYNRGDGFNTRNFRFRPSNYVLQYQEVFSPNLITEFRFGLNRSPLFRVDGNGANVVGPRIDGFTRLRPNVTQRELGTSFSYANNTAYILGPHTLRFGGEFRRIWVNVAESDVIDYRWRTSGAATGAPATYLANLINNRVRAGDFTILTEQPMLGARRFFLLPYLQDDIKARPNLTINAGIRYEYYSVGKEANGRGLVFDIACGGFCPPGTDWYEADRNNFAPRFGAAWGLFGGKTVIRGGYGLFYSPGQNDDINAAIDNVRTRATSNAIVAFPFTPATLPFLPASPRGLQRDRRDTYAQNYSLAVVQELPGKLVLSVGYNGNQGRNLFNRGTLNLPTNNIAGGPRPLANFGDVDTKENRGSSRFDALQVSLNRRASNGFTMGVQYMYSHGLSDFAGSGESGNPQNFLDFRSERASTDFDIRHTVTVNYLYELPFGKGRRFLNSGGITNVLLGGWNLSGITVGRTGRPLTITFSGNPPNGDSFAPQRPNLVPGVSLYNRDRAIGSIQGVSWLNPAAFSIPVAGQFGNAGRNIARGPGLFQVDLSLQKIFTIRERHRVEFRFEAFNLFNRAQFDNPDTILTNATFGVIQSPLSRDIGTGTARSLQFAFRYQF